MTLRDEAITHMAQAIEASEVWRDAWDAWCAFDQDAVALTAFDALLDFLDASGPEWNGVYAHVLVAALRGTTEGEET